MKTWNVFKNDSGDIKLVRFGFNWWAFFFSGLWCLIKGLTLELFVAIILTATINAVAKYGDSTSDAILWLFLLIGTMTMFGYFGNKKFEKKLIKDGYLLVTNVQAKNQSDAKLKFSNNVDA